MLRLYIEGLEQRCSWLACDFRFTRKAAAGLSISPTATSALPA